MLRLIGVVLSVGLADSINPTTVGPGLFLATGSKRTARVTQFTLGVFAVNLIVGIVLTIGPGRALLGLVPRPHPRTTVKHVIEIVAGAVLLAAALLVWLRRRSLSKRALPMSGAGGGGGSSALVAGATVSVVELPTAAPYFAVIAGVVASSATVPQEILLIVLYNVAFVLPLLAIIAVVLFGGPRADELLGRGGAWLQRRWPEVLAGLLLLVGSVLLLIGGAGLVRS